MYICTYLRTYVCTYISVYMDVHIVHMNVRTYVRTCIHTYIHIYICKANSTTANCEKDTAVRMTASFLCPVPWAELQRGPKIDLDTQTGQTREAIPSAISHGVTVGLGP